jgi:hypothetical protein
MTDHDSTPRKPRLEPEILPPGQPDPGETRSAHPGARPRFVFIDARSGRAIPFARPSLLSLVIIAGMVGLAVATALVVVLGAFVLALPVLGLVFLGLLLGSLLRPRR